MGRSLRPLWLALGASLLLHSVLIGGLRWTLPHWESPSEPLPFEAKLVSAMEPEETPLPPLPVQTPPAVKPVAAHPPAHARMLLSVDPPEQPAADAAPPKSMAAPASIEPAVRVEVEPVDPHAAVPVEVAPPPSPPPPSPPPLNPLSPRIDLRFQVHYGPASGEQTLVWVNEDGQHYTLISVAEATGLAGVFYRGKFVQTSRGRITSQGLQPEEFWDQRGDKRSRARFDAAQGRLTLTPDKGAPRHFEYQGEVQDVLSLFFQLALTAPPPEGRLTYTVFNGKKLRDYSYAVRGEVLLETAVGPLRTLHLARVTDGDGRFEVWLAIDRNYLPVRVLRSDDKGNEVELKLLSIAP